MIKQEATQVYIEFSFYVSLFLWYSILVLRLYDARSVTANKQGRTIISQPVKHHLNGVSLVSDGGPLLKIHWMSPKIFKPNHELCVLNPS